MLVLLELGEGGLEAAGQRLLRLAGSGASLRRDLAGGLGGVGAADLRRQLRVGGVALGQQAVGDGLVPAAASSASDSAEEGWGGGSQVLVEAEQGGMVGREGVGVVVGAHGARRRLVRAVGREEQHVRVTVCLRVT